MADAIQAPEEASAETQAILKELQAEGHEIPGSKPQAPEAKADDVTKQEAAVAQAKTDADQKAPDATAADVEKEKPKPVERTSQFVPVSKHNEERHKRQEAEERAAKAEKAARDLEEKLASAANKPNTENQDEIKAFAARAAEKHGIDPEFVSEFAQSIVDLAAKRNVLPKDIESKLAAFEATKAQADALAQEAVQNKAFEDELSGVLKEFPDMADRKEDLKQLAFSEGNINTSLRRIALEYRHDNGLDKAGRRTAEAPLQGRKDGGVEIIDYANITEEQFKNLNDKQHDEYMAWVAKNPRRG